MSVVDGIRETCFACDRRWGSCSCTKVDEFDADGRVREDVDGFEFHGVWITDPSVSLCSRFYVEPSVYYGEAFTTWKARKP